MSDKLGKYNVTEVNEKLLVQGESINDRTIEPAQGDYVTVNGVWYIDALPLCAIVELADGNLAKFFINPFRKLTEKDFTTYKSYHPRKCKGQPLPEYLYRFYGLEKNSESATEVIHIRVTPTEKRKAENYAKDEGKSVSELMRDYIRGLE